MSPNSTAPPPVFQDSALEFPGERITSPKKPGATLKRESRPYYPALDGLRAVAFLLVFATHYLNLPWGWSGVDIFFVLSGFLITAILDGSRDDPHRARNFYVRRTLRIFPLYYLALSLAFLAARLFHMRLSPAMALWPLFLGNWIDILNTLPHHLLTLAPENAHGWIPKISDPRIVLTVGHFWSLCVEEQFYLIWPFVIFRVRNRRILLALCLFVIVACPLVRRFLVHDLAPVWSAQTGFLYSATPMRLDAFGWGALLALWERGQPIRWLRTWVRFGFYVGLAAAFVGLLPQVIRVMQGHTYVYPPWQLTWGMFVVDFLAFCVLVEALRPSSCIYRVLTLSPLRWLGRISFGAYVIHYVPVALLAELAERFPIPYKVPSAAALAIVTTVTLAWASFRYFESPFLRLKQRWAP